MDAIYSATALRDHPKEVKQAAQDRLVRITENGRGAYVFCSEAVFEAELDRAREQALYDLRAAEAIERGERDYASGDYVVGIDAAMREIEKLRSSRGAA